MSLIERLRNWSEGPNTYKLTDEAADRIEALEAKVALTELALREARVALNLIGWSRHPADLLTVKHAAKYEAKAVQAVTKINEVLE